MLLALPGAPNAVFYRSDCDPGRGGCPGDLQEAPRPGPGIAEGNFISKSYQKAVKNYQMKARAVPPPLQRVQKAQKHEGLDRATAKTTTLSRIPAWTPPDAERQCYFFFRGAQFARGRAIFCGKRRYLRRILGVLLWDSQHYRKLKPRIAESTYFVGGLAVPTSSNGSTIEDAGPNPARCRAAVVFIFSSCSFCTR